MIYIFTRSLAGLIFLIWLTGCGQTLKYTPLTNESLEIPNVVVYGQVTQDKVVAQIQKSSISTYTGGGLLFGLIDAAVTEKRTGEMETLIKPLREATDDFNFRKSLEKALMENLNSPYFQNIYIGGVLEKMTEEDRNQLLKRSPEKSLFQIQMVYWLTANYKRLTVVTLASLWKFGRETPIFHNEYVYHTPPVSKSGDISEIIGTWSENKGERIKVKLNEGIYETIKMIKRDLSKEKDVVIRTVTPPLWVPLSETKMTNPDYLESKGNQYLMRAPNGTLVSLSSDETI
jgi:hypothetical protein